MAMMLLAGAGASVLALFLLMARRNRGGPQIIYSHIPNQIFSSPKTRGHWIVWLIWIFVTARFAFLIIQPIFDGKARAEYRVVLGGPSVAGLLYFMLYLPFLAMYVWCAFFFDQRNKNDHDIKRS